MFLNWPLLFGLTALSVPIIIHLLNRRKFEHVVWAAMRFIQQAVEQNQRRIQIEDIILLILRCLIIALIVLALARCAWQQASGGKGDSTTTVIVLDNSASMCQRVGPTTHFDQAKQLAQNVLNDLPKGASVSLVLVSDVANPVIADPTTDHDAVRKAIEQATLTDRGSNILPGIKLAMEKLKEAHTIQKEIYTITDSQRLGWKQNADVQQLIEANKKEVSTTVIFTGDMPHENLAVTELRLDSEIAAVNQPLRFSAQVTNFALPGTPPAKNIELSLRVDSDTTVSSTATVTELRPGESKSVLLSAKVAKEGYHSVTVSVPHDEVPADDSRSLALRVVKQVQVLLVDGEPGREARDSKAFYLKHVLQPVDQTQRESYFIQSKVVSPADMAGQRLDGFDVIMLANVTDLPAEDLPALERFVKNGGGLVVFPGANANVPFYNEQLYRKRSMLPAALGAPTGDATQNAKFLTFQTKDFSHPISDLWNDADRGNPGTVHFYRVYDLVKGDRSKMEVPTDVTLGEVRTVMNYSDGKPAILERSWGMGRVVLFSSGAETSWNDLPVRAKIYVPLMMRTVGNLVGREDELLNIRAGEMVAAQQPAELIGKDVLITPPGDEKSPPHSTRIDLVGNVAMLKFEHTDRAGVYNALVGDETIKFAAGANPEESSIEQINPDDLKEIQTAGAAVVEWKQGMQVEDTLRQTQGAKPLEFWMPLAALALLLATAETFLAHVFSRPK